MATTKEQALAGVKLFGQLSKRQSSRLARVADIVSVDEGAILIKEGERGRELIVIVEGSAVVRRNNRKIAGLGAGDSLGEMSLLDRQPATATVVTTEPCQLVVIDGRRFESELENLPGLARNLLATLSTRLRETNKALDL
jgi:CRP-like cAMP-binding protein